MVPDQLVPVVQCFGAVSDVGEANGPPVSEAFAKNVSPLFSHGLC